ncbi:MAG: Ribosomal protein lysine methyltransferase [Alyxoria varia]|nr:MAG: Ribosomal protein lysine methyltransferase [Alyxoria varia]
MHPCEHLSSLLETAGIEIEDAEEETFIVFSGNSESSQDLGMVGPKSDNLEISINGSEFDIFQSPKILASTRNQGTTGFVVWKASLKLASWLKSPQNVLFRRGLLSQQSTILELGCGVSPVVGLSVVPRVSKFIATDQDHVLKALKQNIDENRGALNTSRSRKNPLHPSPELLVKHLDWELHDLDRLAHCLGQDGVPDKQIRRRGIDMVTACDCVYNEYLMEPFVKACVSVCKARNEALHEDSTEQPTFCLIAQQLRSSDIFELWLKTMLRHFHVFKMPPEEAGPEFAEGCGFVIHLAVLKR